MRTDDGERPTLLQLDYGDRDLRKAFLDWDAVGEGTRGVHTLYHAQISPDPRYKLTPEQCRRAAQILAEDLGMADHPRAVILHDGGDKPHIHVVIMRTDLQTMKMWDDHLNYVKHERASYRMELEFGHEVVPGKHARKRNRQKQPEMPRAKATQDDYQQAERTGMSFDERREQIASIRQSCDNAQAFRSALEEAGYVLARGDKRGFVLVDGDGEIFSLSKHLAGDIKGKEYKAFMAGIDPAALPTVDEAKAMRTEILAEAQKPAQETKEVPQEQAPEKAPEPTPAPPASKFLPDLSAPQEAATKQAEQASKFLPPVAVPQKPAEVPPPQLPVQPAAQEQPKEDPEIAAIRAAVEQRQAKEARILAERQAEEFRQREYDLAIYYADKIKHFDRLLAQREEAMVRRQQAESRPGRKGIIESIKDRLNPKPAPGNAEAQRELEQLKIRHQEERTRYTSQLQESIKLQLENLRERHALELSDRARRNEEETERYIHEQLEAKRLAQELEAERLRREMERTRSLEDGPEPPEPGKG